MSYAQSLLLQNLSLKMQCMQRNIQLKIEIWRKPQFITIKGRNRGHEGIWYVQLIFERKQLCLATQHKLC